MEFDSWSGSGVLISICDAGTLPVATRLPFISIPSSANTNISGV